jgi:hypothetical protein
MSMMNLVTPKAGAKCELLFNKPASALCLFHKGWTMLEILSIAKEFNLFLTTNKTYKIGLSCPIVKKLPHGLNLRQ